MALTAPVFAPPLRRLLAVSGEAYFAAQCRGVSSEESYASTQAPCELGSHTQANAGGADDKCSNPNDPHLIFAVGFHTLDRSQSATSLWSPDAARCSGVLPELSSHSTSAPLLTRSLRGGKGENARINGEAMKGIGPLSSLAHVQVSTGGREVKG